MAALSGCREHFAVAVLLYPYDAFRDEGIPFVLAGVPHWGRQRQWSWRYECLPFAGGGYSFDEVEGKYDDDALDMSQVRLSDIMGNVGRGFIFTYDFGDNGLCR